jgi:NADH pyrophosphatase NudC (nudix superfamily)
MLLIYREVNGTAGYEAAGGRVEVNFESKSAETFEACAIREIKEEIGVDVKLLSYLGSYTFFWDMTDNTCSVCVVFLGEIIGGTIKNENVDPNEIAYDIRWVKILDVLNGNIPVRAGLVGLKPLLVKSANIIKKLDTRTEVNKSFDYLN